MDNTHLHQAIAGALTGLVTAIEADFDAFRAWQSWHDAAVYDWRTASFRWAKGIVIGALSGLGLGAALGF